MFILPLSVFWPFGVCWVDLLDADTPLPPNPPTPQILSDPLPPLYAQFPWPSDSVSKPSSHDPSLSPLFFTRLCGVVCVCVCACMFVNAHVASFLSFLYSQQRDKLSHPLVSPADTSCGPGPERAGFASHIHSPIPNPKIPGRTSSKKERASRCVISVHVVLL